MSPKNTTPKKNEAQADGSPISASTFPALREFLRGYFHQDWQDEYDSPAEAAQQFCDDASPEERQELAREWETFRQRTKNLSLPAVSEVLNSKLGADWAPQTLADFDAVSAVFRPFAHKM